MHAGHRLRTRDHVFGCPKDMEDPPPSAMGWVQGTVCLRDRGLLGGTEHHHRVLGGLTLDAAAAHAQAAGVRLQGGLAGELVPCQVPAEE